MLHHNKSSHADAKTAERFRSRSGRHYKGITLENNIYFRPGGYEQGTIAGTARLAHELMHVGQFRNGMTRNEYLWCIRSGYSNDTKYEKPGRDLQLRIIYDFNFDAIDCECQARWPAYYSVPLSF